MKGCINMADKNYEIKMDGKEHKFGEATRYTKDGKGRFDLIPSDVMAKVIEYIYKGAPHDTDVNRSYYFGTESKIKLYRYAMSGNYVKTIVMLSMFEYHDPKTNQSMYTVDEVIIAISRAVNKMLYDLAIHFQKGAEKYGERNCEKGIPEWSFKDSGLRHMCQYLDGKNDENHFIASIWNFWMAEWTVLNHPERCIGYKAPETKSESVRKDESVKCNPKNNKVHYRSEKHVIDIGEESVSKILLKDKPVRELIGDEKVYNALKPLISIIVHQPKFASWLKETYSDVDVWDIYIALLLYEYDEPIFMNGAINMSTMNVFVRVLPIVCEITERKVRLTSNHVHTRTIYAYRKFLQSGLYELSLTSKMPIGKLIDACRQK